MKEKNFQTEFKEKNKIHGVFELKLCKGTSIGFSSVAEHQREALLQVSTEGLYHKIADSPVSWGGQRFTKKKPFDCFYLKGVPAYVVIQFYKPRKKKDVYYIPITRFLKAEEEAKRKSLTEEMCNEISDFEVSFLKLSPEQSLHQTQKGV